MGEIRLPEPHPDAAQIAAAFHTAYESMAPLVGYATRTESAVPWEDVPSANKKLMIATVTTLLQQGMIR